MEAQEPKQRIYTVHNKTCKGCGKEYPAKLARSKFCSGTCRAAYARKHPTEDITDIEPIEKKSDLPATMVTSLPGLPPQAQYIIGHMKELNAELKEDNKDLKKALDDLKVKNDSLKEELATIKREHEIEAIRNEKPSGLAGLAENPMIQQMIPHVMPHIGESVGKLITKLVDKGTGQMGGVEVPGEGEVKQQALSIANWYAKQDKPTQESVYWMINTFVGMSTEQIASTISKINNLLKHGTTAQPFGNYTGTFN